MEVNLIFLIIEGILVFLSGKVYGEMKGFDKGYFTAIHELIMKKIIQEKELENGNDEKA